MAAPTPGTMSLAGWWLIALSAFAVAAYALTLVAVPAWRPPYAAELISAQPLAACLHFLGGGLALMIGALQANRWLRTRYRRGHRWLGRVYVAAVAAGGGAALVMALRSPAGIAAQLGFGLLAVLWLATTLLAWRRIRAGDLDRHRQWMLRSYALTLAAVTLRLYLPLSQVAGIPFPLAYSVIAWLCWLPNLMLAEWLLSDRSARSTAAVAPSRSGQSGPGLTVG